MIVRCYFIVNKFQMLRVPGALLLTKGESILSCVGLALDNHLGLNHFSGMYVCYVCYKKNCVRNCLYSVFNLKNILVAHLSRLGRGGSLSVSGKLPNYPSPKPFHLGQSVN